MYSAPRQFYPPQHTLSPHFEHLPTKRQHAFLQKKQKPRYRVTQMNAVTIGSAVCDITLVGTALTERKILCQKEGAKLSVDDINMRAGGGALNSALIMHKFGIKPHPVCCIGIDAFNTPIKKTLTENKIYDNFIKISDTSKTAISILLPHEDKQTTILTYKGAGFELDYTWAERITKQTWDILYLAPIAGPLNQHLVALASQIKEKNPQCIVAHNPNPHQLQTTMAEQKNLLPLLDLYILNHREAKIAWDVEHSTPFTTEHYLKELALIAPKCIFVVTQGINGLDWQQGETSAHVAAKKIEPLHSVGAGDSCGAAITAALALGKSPEEAIQLGMQTAEHVLTAPGIAELATVPPLR